MSKFQKRHYEEIAKELKACKEDGEIPANQIENFVSIMGFLFIRDNPKFNLQRFRKACGELNESGASRVQ